jgi:7,8-dihydropterin-6-yl-methyl-4-(beta-D-ribofuranosyl)aminobenzene 5'-phosphate synthase
MSERVSLEPVDAANVTVLVDNFIDALLPSSEVAQRPQVAYEMWEREREQLIAEHGLSLLLTIERDGYSASLIYDAGLSHGAAIHNMDVLGVRLPDLRAIVMSHGHSDHHGGLEGMIRRVGARGMPLVIHPEAWRDRKVIFPTGAEFHLPPPSRQDLDREGVEVTEERQPSLLIDGMVLVTGRHTRLRVDCLKRTCRRASAPGCNLHEVATESPAEARPRTNRAIASTPPRSPPPPRPSPSKWPPTRTPSTTLPRRDL